MAGFDFRVPVPPQDREYARVLLRYLQRLARYRPCDRPTTLRFEWCPPSQEHNYNNYRVTVDGDFAEIQALCADSIRAIYHFSQGYVAAQPKYKKSWLPEVVPLAFLKGIHEFHEGFNEIRDALGKMGVALSPNSYHFKRTGTAIVDKILGATSAALLQWRNGSAPTTVLAEQLHTACEVLSKASLSAPNRGVSFGELVAEVARRGFISSDQEGALNRLKDLRRDAKHRGQGIGEEPFASLLPNIVGAIHSLSYWCEAKVESNSLR